MELEFIIATVVLKVVKQPIGQLFANFQTRMKYFQSSFVAILAFEPYYEGLVVFGKCF